MRLPAWMMAIAVGLLLLPAHAGPKRSLGITVHGVKKRVSPKEALKLTAKLQWQGPKAEFSYAWSSKAGPALPFDAARSSETLAIAQGELKAGSRYELELRVVAKFTDPDSEPPEQQMEATSDIVFDVNAPPSGGKCEMDVTWRGKAQAWLTISAPDWSDDHDKRVQYRYEVVRNGKARLANNWSHKQRYAMAALARPGDTIQAKCLVRDTMGDTTEKLSDEMTRPN